MSIAHYTLSPPWESLGCERRMHGRPALIGSISDGYSVVFNLGSDDAACSEWALVAHSIASIDVLEQVALGLVPNP